jgi:cell division protein FtsQ
MTPATKTPAKAGASNTTEPADLSAARRSRRMRWWLIAAGVLVAAAVIGLAYLVYGTHVLAVRTIIVRGATVVKVQDILTAADVPIGTPLARVDVGAVRNRVEALPRVSTVEVRRGWPHQLVIVVHEYTPVAVTMSGGKWFMVDPSGIAFMPAPKVSGLPQVQGSSIPARAAAIVVAKSLPRSISRYVELTRAKRADQVELLLSDKSVVLWGDTGQAANKAQVLLPLLAVPAKKYDVSVPSAPSVTR